MLDDIDAAAVRIINIIDRGGLPVGRDSHDVAKAYLRMRQRSDSVQRAARVCDKVLKFLNESRGDQKLVQGMIESDLRRVIKELSDWEIDEYGIFKWSD